MPAPIIVSSVTSVTWDVLTGAWGASIREKHLKKRSDKRAARSRARASDNPLAAAYLGVPQTVPPKPSLVTVLVVKTTESYNTALSIIKA